MLTRIFELLEEIIQFLINQNNDFVEAFGNRDALLQLAYLAVIFSRMNEVSTSVQGFALKCLLQSVVF